MDDDWLLVETLGTEPVVVAEGRQILDMIPITEYLRKKPDLQAIQTAIAETVATGESLASITPKANLVIRTEPVQMSDGRVHGVQVWSGPSDAEPPERPIPGPLKWDLTAGMATDTVESLTNAGMDPAEESTSGRAFADDMPSRDLNQHQAKVLALTIAAQPGQTYWATWDITDKQGQPRRVGFVARTAVETAEDGAEHLITRAINLAGELDEWTVPTEQTEFDALCGDARPGVYRALVDLNNWHLLKWLDDPCPYFNWRADLAQLGPMTEAFEAGATGGVLRLPGNDGDLVPIHVTVDRIEVDKAVYAGLITLRLPTEEELTQGQPVDIESP